ncbi:uncharacterized protein LOC125046512 [Penaeus chinensis]|uniref:uncharacterized protein LOC125046512 n=1 Tax=Penaeus chinensis TaxID=139456 RepID=UPI001FB7C7D2|nr:uncharacterized protein LOC125046512 [Penaeus chinensis]
MVWFLAGAAWAVSAGENSAIVLEPVKDGLEVVYVFLPGSYSTNDRYVQFGEALQAASPHRLWVGLVGIYMEDYPDPAELDAAVTACLADMRLLGMNSTDVFISGHSLGGQVAVFYPETRDIFRGLVLLGAYLDHGLLASYPIPVLTLAGDLDGSSRVTRMVDAFTESQAQMALDSEAVFRVPTIIPEDVNHASYYNDSDGLQVPDDILTPLPSAEAKARISQHVADFITATLGKPSAAVDDARSRLLGAYDDTNAKMKPIQDLRAVTEEMSRSPWSEMSQKILANTATQDDWRYMNVSDHIHDNTSFVSENPHMTLQLQTLSIATQSHVTRPADPYYYEPLTAFEIAIKMKSQEAIKEELEPLGVLFNKPVTCKELNMAAFDRAFNSPVDVVRDRFIERGRNITFFEDVVDDFATSWLASSHSLVYTDAGLEVTARRFHTASNNPDLRGLTWCKLVPPERFLEYIMVDGLKGTKP